MWNASDPKSIRRAIRLMDDKERKGMERPPYMEFIMEVAKRYAEVLDNWQGNDK